MLGGSVKAPAFFNTIKKYKMKILILFLLAIQASIGQNILRPTVAINTFSSAGQTKFAEAITNQTNKCMVKSQQFRVINKAAASTLLKTLQENVNEVSMESEITVAIGKHLQAQYILNGHIDIINITRVVSGNKVTGYKAALVFTISLINVETGVTQSIESFETKIGKGMSPEFAIAKSIESIEKKMNKYFQSELL